MQELTPGQLAGSYRMPAEWSVHSGTLLSWPANRETWPGERLDRVEKIYADIIEVLTRFEPVHLLIPDQQSEIRMNKALRDRHLQPSGLILHNVPTNDVWVRDWGPIMVKNTVTGEFAITDWGYNAWGGKYLPYDDDNRIPEYFSAKYGIPRFSPGMILEGGSIETDGEGTLLTTKSVLLNPNRNPGLTRTQVELRLKKFLGMDRIIWLGDGLAGDDTDGHIDDLTRFLNPSTILTMTTDDEKDINYRALNENLEFLRDLKQAGGRPYDIITLPLPETRIEGTTVDGSENVPASYANYYVANDVVILPVYDRKYDGQAIEIMKHYYSDRHIAAIPCADLVWGQGSVHCITQQLFGI